MSRFRPRFAVGGKRPKCIGTKTIIIDGKPATVRVFEPYGKAEESQKLSSRINGANFQHVGQRTAFEERVKRLAARRGVHIPSR